MPGYGYIDVIDGGFIDQKAPQNTGVFLVNLTTKERTLLFSIAQLAADIHTYPDNKDYYHYITHTSFSRDERYVSCLHRYVALDDLDKRFTRLVIYDRLTQKIFHEFRVLCAAQIASSPIPRFELTKLRCFVERARF